MTPKQAAQTVALLAAAYPYAKVSVDTSQVYENMLGDLDFDVTKQAVARLVTTSKFMPTIAEIREASTALRLGPPRTGGEAWADACAAVRKVGRYGTPKWQDPILAETMRLWGAWRDFCNSPEDDPGGRARFIEMYDQLAARKRADVVSGIALPAPGAPLRLVESNGRKTEAKNSGRLTDGVGSDDARLPAGRAPRSDPGTNQAKDRKSVV